MNFQSCLCVTPWVWICFFWIEGTLYEIATQIYCQDKILELFWQHWKLEIIQISICQEDNLQCTLSVRVHQLCQMFMEVEIYFYTYVTALPCHNINVRCCPWRRYSTNWFIYQRESESGFRQIAEFGFLEIWPIFQVK